MAAKGTEAGKAYVTLGLNAESLERGLKKAGDKVSAMGKRVAVAGGGVAAAGAAVLTPLLAATSSFAAAGDKLQKMSLRTGASVESLSAMAFAAEQSGTSIEAVGDAMFRTGRRIANAAQTGMGPAARALKLLGVDMDELNNMSADEQFLKLADVLGSLEDEAFANQMGFEILGDSFKQLKPLLDEGSDGIRALMNEAGELGRTMSTDDANAAAAFGDAMNRVSSVAVGLKNQIGAALAPAITEAADVFAKFASGAIEFMRNNRGLVVGIAAAAAAVVGIGTAITVVGFVIMGVGAAISALGTIVGVVLGPAGLLIGGIVAAGVAAAHHFGLIEKAIGFVSEAFEKVSKVFSDNFGTILDELKAGNIENAMAIAAEAVELIWLDLGEGMLDWWDEVVSGLASRIKDFVTGAQEAFSFLGTLMEKFDQVYGSIYNKIYESVVTGITEMGGVRTIGEYNVDAYSQDPILNMDPEGMLDEFITTPEERERRRQERERRRQELRERGERRRREREERIAREENEITFNDSKANDYLNETPKVLEDGQRSSRGTFSAFAARALGAGTFQEKLLKANKDTAKNTADIAKNTAMPNPAVFNA